jgi:hypothetical protein
MPSICPWQSSSQNLPQLPERTKGAEERQGRRRRNWVFKTCRRLGLSIIPYGYWLTFATDALVNGTPDAIVAQLLGHQGTAVLHRHYSHLTARLQALRQAAEKVRPLEWSASSQVNAVPTIGAWPAF